MHINFFNEIKLTASSMNSASPKQTHLQTTYVCIYKQILLEFHNSLINVFKCSTDEWMDGRTRMANLLKCVYKNAAPFPILNRRETHHSC